MDKTTAIEMLELEITTKRRRAEMVLDLPRNAPRSKRAAAELLAKDLLDTATAIELALNALKGN